MRVAIPPARLAVGRVNNAPAAIAVSSDEERELIETGPSCDTAFVICSHCQVSADSAWRNTTVLPRSGHLPRAAARSIRRTLPPAATGDGRARSTGLVWTRRCRIA
jgi:hypothetical protein